MKKNILTTLLLAGIFAYANAQVGVNTDEPKATLDIGLATDDVADGIIVTKVTVEDLDDVSDLYSADHHGTLVYVTGGTSKEAKTKNIKSPGFYYYDTTGNNGNGIWSTMSPGYGGGTFTISSSNVELVAGVDLLEESKSGKYNHFEFYHRHDTHINSKYYDLVFPDPKPFEGQTIYIANITGGFITYSNLPPELEFLIGITPGTAQQFYSTGETWYVMAGRY